MGDLSGPINPSKPNGLTNFQGFLIISFLYGIIFGLIGFFTSLKLTDIDSE